MKIIWDRTFKTKRLIIRPFTQRDYNAWKRAHQNRLPKQNQFDSGPVPEKELTKIIFKKKIAGYREIAKKDSIYVYGIFDKQTGENLGGIDIFVMARFGFQWANLGYYINNQHCGNGYAKEAAKAGLRIGFKTLKLQRIEGATELDNYASIAVMKASGMKKECIRKKFYREKNRWIDMVVFIKLAT